MESISALLAEICAGGLPQISLDAMSAPSSRNTLIARLDWWCAAVWSGVLDPRVMPAIWPPSLQGTDDIGVVILGGQIERVWGDWLPFSVAYSFPSALREHYFGKRCMAVPRSPM